MIVVDFSENHHHEPRYEHQSKYFNQASSTLLPVVCRFRIEDAKNIDDKEKQQLLEYNCKENKLPPVIVETHMVVSNDMQHDNAFVQKAFEGQIFPHIKTNFPDVHTALARSDGCKAQFKCASHFDWVSSCKTEGPGLNVHWSFFESCHGKCDCDPEGGSIKNAARRQELCHTKDNPTQMRYTEELYEWLSKKSGLQTPTKTFEQKKGRGVYRRFFYFTPPKGPWCLRK